MLSTYSSKITAFSDFPFVLQNLKQRVSFASSPSSTKKARYFSLKTGCVLSMWLSNIYLSSCCCIEKSVSHFTFYCHLSYYIVARRKRLFLVLCIFDGD